RACVELRAGAAHQRVVVGIDPAPVELGRVLARVPEGIVPGVRVLERRVVATAVDESARRPALLVPPLQERAEVHVVQARADAQRALPALLEVLAERLPGVRRVVRERDL